MSSQPSDQLKKRTFYPNRWPHKTVDIGANGVTVSANPLGQIYQISSPLNAANKFGIMVAALWHQFDQAQRTNPRYVREFRKIPENLLMRQETGLGLDFGGPKGPVVIRPIHSSIGSQVQFEYRVHGDNKLFVQTALRVHNDGTITHASKVTNMSTREKLVPVTLNLVFAVSRAGYGQLTDRGAVAMPNPSNTLKSFRGANGAGVLVIENPSLGGRVLVRIVFYNEATHEYIEVQDSLYAQQGEQENPPQRLNEKAIQGIRLGSGQTLKLVISFRPENVPSTDPVTFFRAADGADEIAPNHLFSHQDGMYDSKAIAVRHDEELFGFNRDTTESIESTILWANVNYILGCCCVPMSGPEGDGVCCIADHFALNLGWPRDNYWQMRLLRELDWANLTQLWPHNPEIATQYDRKIRQALTNHLIWLFQMSVTQIKIDGEIRHFWRRSYLVNGKPKDGKVFQLDTQCYPFLELCEYFDAFGDEPRTGSVVEYILQTDSFKNILQDLLSRQDRATNLFSSDETPADDDLGDYKFHLSSNILLWHTLCKLSGLLSHPHFRPLVPEARGENLGQLAVTLRDSILINFRSRQTFAFSDGTQIDQDILAYGFDPSKQVGDPMRYRHYHDGNDMPTLYAQEWGFLTNDFDEEDDVDEEDHVDYEQDHFDYEEDHFDYENDFDDEDNIDDEDSIDDEDNLDDEDDVDDEDDDPDLRELWENTMAWAFMPGPPSAGYNSGYKGKGSERFHGLGSDHSPGPWTLGFFQEWRFAQMVGDNEREHKAWRQIVGSAQFDGTFSEAVDIETGVCTSTTWFSWPGAMIAENLIDIVIEQVQQGTP